MSFVGSEKRFLSDRMTERFLAVVALEQAGLIHEVNLIRRELPISLFLVN